MASNAKPPAATSRRPRRNGSRPPPRPKTAVDYTPTPIITVAHTDTLNHLINEGQGSPAEARVHSFPRDRLTSFSQMELSSPTSMSKSFSNSWESKKSALRAAAQRLSLNIGRGGEIIKKKLTPTKNKKPAAEEKDKGQLSRSSTSSSNESLFHRRRLPKLKIPELHIAVDEALHSACSTDTQESPTFRILELSPTSRELKFQWERDHHPADIAAEFHNMLSARRRVRKGKFGTVVTKYRAARPTWDDSWVLRIRNDNHEDRELLSRLTDALQEQKDHAARLMQKKPDAYPGFETVSVPGCTLPLYWQHKSSYR